MILPVAYLFLDTRFVIAFRLAGARNETLIQCQQSAPPPRSIVNMPEGHCELDRWCGSYSCFKAAGCSIRGSASRSGRSGSITGFGTGIRSSIASTGGAAGRSRSRFAQDSTAAVAATASVTPTRRPALPRSRFTFLVRWNGRRPPVYEPGPSPGRRQSDCCSRSTASSDLRTFSIGDMPPIVSATLPSGVTINVVRSAKPCPISTPRVSFAPSRPSRTWIS